MKTMTKEPYVYHVPVLTGGKGYDEVYTFYSNNFVGSLLILNLYVFQEQ